MALNIQRSEPTWIEPSTEYFGLSLRERQILEILYLSGETTAREVQRSLPDGPGYSAVRATLRILEHKGAVKHREQGLRYVFFPAIEREKAKRSALRRLARVFLKDSIEDILRTLLSILPERDGTGEVIRFAAKLKKQSKSGNKAEQRPTGRRPLCGKR